MEIILTSKESLESLVEESVKRALDHHGSTPETEWITNKQALEYLSVSRPTLQRYRSSGKIMFSKIGSKLYYRRADIEALLEQNIRTNPDQQN